jgi:hypothetical protein
MHTMAVIDLVNLVDQRLQDIMEQNPSMSADEFYFTEETGLWCLITILGSEGRAIEYDFIESETSWKRANARIEYFQVLLEQVTVMIIVPDQSLADVLLMVRDTDTEGLLVTDYSAIGLIPLPLTY